MERNYLAGKNKIHKKVNLIAFNYIENSQIGSDCVLYGSKLQNCVIGKNVRITNSVLQDCAIADNCVIGPFAFIREGAVVESDCRIGDFVEVKNSHIGVGSKSAHLAYIGDADVGAGCNIGCGCVFANYNGKIKQKIVVGSNSFIGANVNLVAPLEVGEQCYIGAGTTLRNDLPAKTFLVCRTENISRRNKFADKE